MANEKRLIDANALICKLRKSAEYHESRRPGCYSAIEHIREQPTADAVDVVRCKDCKYIAQGTTYCTHAACRGTPFTRQPYDFCSYGERKDNT